MLNLSLHFLDSHFNSQAVPSNEVIQQASAPKAKRNILEALDTTRPARNVDFQITRTGSSGSLDAAIAPNVSCVAATSS